MPGSLYARLRARHGPTPNGPTRREALQLTLAATAGWLLSARGGLAQTGRGRRILIVGGGFAGLAAAHELASLGYDVRLFEARNRLGGRVVSFHDLAASKTVEGGAELIGSNHPSWLAYKEKFGLAFRDVTEESGESPVVIDGQVLTHAQSEALWAELEGAYARLNALAAPIAADQPWSSAGAAELDRRTTAAWIDAQPVSARARVALHSEFQADNGVDAAWQSLLGNLAQIKGGGLERYWTDTEVFRCAGGNDQLARKLAGTLAADRIRTRTVVRRVVVTSDRAAVTLADGTTVEGDDVILAVPPSVWHKIAFEPALPPALVPQMGHNVKFLAVVRSRFWRPAGRTPNLLANGPVNLTWEATDNQPGPGVVLTAFSGGHDADTCREWSAADRSSKYLGALARAYPGLGAAFVRARFMDWPSDPWTLASYAFPAPGQIVTQGPTLREGIGRLHFVGEHTNYAFIGYMEGALGSGIALAKRLATRDGIVAHEAVGYRPTASHARI